MTDASAQATSTPSTTGNRKVFRGQYLFRENDPSDAMYVVKAGRIAIVKAKGSSEIVLAEIGPGQMLGEMAFFDNRPRSAGAKAAVDSEVIALPFSALYAQFKHFPEWLKAMVKTVNNHLRDANQRIKNLERANTEEEEVLSPHRITKLLSILGLVAHRYGEKTENGAVFLSMETIRRFTIQVFQEPTNRMLKMLEALTRVNYVKIEDLGEGRQKVSVFNLDFLLDLVAFYNEYLFEEESKRLTIDPKEIGILKALVFYGKKSQPTADGSVHVSLTEMQNDSMRDLGYVVKPEETASLSEKKVIGEMMSGENQNLTIEFKLNETEKLLQNWDLIYQLRKVR